MAIYMFRNGPMVTTASPVSVTTGAVVKTLLQLAPSAGNPVLIKEWGISFDGSAAATPIKCELVDTYLINATVTAAVSADVQPFTGSADVGQTACTLGTAATGYTASAEGTIVATRHGDAQLVAPTNQYIKQFPLGGEFYVPGAHFLRIRVTAAAAVNAICYVIFADL